jgi:hypothetical protein
MFVIRSLLMMLVVLVVPVGPAAANVHDVVFAINKIQLHVRPGEAAPVVGHAEEGDELEVLGFRGRWLRVRNGKQTGWVTRTEVAETKPAEPRNRSMRGGFSGKPVTDAVKVTVEIDSVRGFDDPRTKSKNVLNLVRGDVLTVIGRGHDGWILVQTDDGGVGWIPASAVSDAGNFEADPRRAPAEVAKPEAASEPASPVPAPAPAVATTEVRAARSRPTPWLTGAMLASGGAQSFKMAHSGQDDASAIASGAIAVIAARAQARVLGSIWVGVATDMEIGTAGLTYYGAAPAQPSPSMSTRELVIDGHAEVGWGRLPYLAVRGGLHYATLSVKSDRDEPMLIGERIGGPTAGIAGALPIPLGRLWLSGAVDYMPAGAQKLDRLPAGTLHATGVKGFWAHSTLAMPLPMHLVVAVSYRFGMLSADLTDGGATPKTATRTDQSHLFAAGVGLAW